MSQNSPGKKFRELVASEKPLQCVGAVNAYHARLAEASGFNALYISGGGVAAGSCGIPDLGITTMEDVLTDLKRITDVTSLPVLVDVDTGWGGAFNIARTVRSMIKGGAAAIHIEDQVAQKRCGHRPNKAIVPQVEMVDRIKAAVDAKTDPDFVIMARTDALAVEGMEAAIDRMEDDDGIWVGILQANTEGQERPVFCAGADLKAINSGQGASLMTERGGFAGFGISPDRMMRFIFCPTTVRGTAESSASV